MPLAGLVWKRPGICRAFSLDVALSGVSLFRRVTGRGFVEGLSICLSGQPPFVPRSPFGVGEGVTEGEGLGEGLGEGFGAGLASSSRFIRFALRGFRYLPSSPTLGPFCFSLDPADLGSDLKLLASNKGVCHNFSSCFDGRGGDAEDDVHKPH